MLFHWYTISYGELPCCSNREHTENVSFIDVVIFHVTQRLYSEIMQQHVYIHCSRHIAVSCQNWYEEAWNEWQPWNGLKGDDFKDLFAGEILNNVKSSNMLCHMTFLDNKLWLASVHHLIFFHFVFLKIKSLKLIE